MKFILGRLPGKMNRRSVPRISSLTLIGLVISVCLCGSAIAAGPPPVAPEIVAAFKGLKKTDAAGRSAFYDLLQKQGDARLIPALKAYRDSSLQLRDDGVLSIYGERVDVPGKGKVLPVVDAITGTPILGPDGAPLYVLKPDLSKSLKAPPRGERATIADLISTLSLLDPDPIAHLQSIRDAGERAGRAFIEPADQQNYARQLRTCRDAIATLPQGKDTVAAIDAGLAQKKQTLLMAIPDSAAVGKITAALTALQQTNPRPEVAAAITGSQNYQDYLDAQQKILDELPKYSQSLHRQLDTQTDKGLSAALREAAAELDTVLGDPATQLTAISTLGSIGTTRADNLLHKIADAASAVGDPSLDDAAQQALHKADRRQTEIQFVQNTFAGFSLGSILVLLALGLSIIFGLMGVINMAQGEFMMVGAFTTYVVSEWFRHHAPGAFNYYLLAAIPAAFMVSAFVGLLCEILVIRHLYGRPLETLLATWGIGLILIQLARVEFGDTLSVTPPSWMEGGVEVVPDLFFPLNRIYIMIFCAICIGVIYFLVNWTKLGLLLRATTQNRQMASALGVATRRVDALTFALGAGLAGLAGVAVPLYNKINPSIGQEYIVDCFMVVVVGGVGKLAGAIIAGLGLGFMNKYLESILSSFPSIESGASVYAKVIVLGLIVLFLNWRPAGMFPPKGRVADA
ncbi:MAG: urea ABC transporter permease subunit UrtB [Planctomycetota bacterium]|nr:urea ABC transporter permease subunit UrtB [Planctomycetota bacterium]